MDLGQFFAIIVSFTGAAVIVIGTVAFAVGYLKRIQAKSPGHLSTEELDDIRARLAELEQRDGRLEQLEERLDFVERVLGRSREARPLRDPSRE